MVLEILLVVITIILYMVMFELWAEYIRKQPNDNDEEYFAAMAALAESLKKPEE